MSSEPKPGSGNERLESRPVAASGFATKESGGFASVGHIECPRCHKTLLIGISPRATVKLSKPPRKRKFRLEPDF